MKTKESAPEQYKNTVFLVDESSMQSNKQTEELTAIISSIGARAVLICDISQLQSLDAGKPFELGIRQQKLATTVMKDIVRQQNTPLLNAVEHIIDRSLNSTIESLDAQASLPASQKNNHGVSVPEKQEITEKDTISNPPHVVSTYEKITSNHKENTLIAQNKIYEVATKEYLERTPESRENTLIIAYSNAERDHVTDLIRQGLQSEASLGTENRATPRLQSLGLSQEKLSLTSSYKKGDIVTQNQGNIMSFITLILSIK